MKALLHDFNGPIYSITDLIVILMPLAVIIGDFEPVTALIGNVLALASYFFISCNISFTIEHWNLGDHETLNWHQNNEKTILSD